MLASVTAPAEQRTGVLHADSLTGTGALDAVSPGPQHDHALYRHSSTSSLLEVVKFSVAVTVALDRPGGNRL
jgi:hypothetical protein